MPMKPGATYRDKNRIRTLFLAGKQPDEIAATVNVALKAVVAICKQVQDGTLRLGPPPVKGEVDRTPPGSSGVAGAGSYTEGEEDSDIPHMEPGAVQRKLEDTQNAENEDLRRQLAEAQEKLAEHENAPEVQVEVDTTADLTPEVSESDTEED